MREASNVVPDFRYCCSGFDHRRCTLSLPEVNLDIPGFSTEAAIILTIITQLALSHLHTLYFSDVHIYTNESTNNNWSTFAFYIPAGAITCKFCLSRYSPTVADLYVILCALMYVYHSSVPQSWVIQVDSQVALLSLNSNNIDNSTTSPLQFLLLPVP